MQMFLVVAISLIVVMIIVDMLTGSKKTKAMIAEKYGEVEWQNPLDGSREYYHSLKHDSFKEIDEQTWRDLNMEEFYQKVNHTQSLIGEAYLYKTLHTLEDEEELNKKEALINYFEEHPNERTEAQYLLFLLGKTENTYIHAFSDYLEKTHIKGKKLFFIFAFFPILSFFLFPLSLGLGVTTLFITLSINVILYLYAELYLSKINYLIVLAGLMCKYGDKFLSLLDPTSDYYEQLEKITKEIKPLKKKLKGSSLKIHTFDVSFVLYIFKIFILSQARCFFKVKTHKNFDYLFKCCQMSV